MIKKILLLSIMFCILPVISFAAPYSITADINSDSDIILYPLIAEYADINLSIEDPASDYTLKFYNNAQLIFEFKPEMAGPFDDDGIDEYRAFDIVVNISDEVNKLSLWKLGGMLAEYSLDGSTPEINSFDVINQNNEFILSWNVSDADNEDVFVWLYHYYNNNFTLVEPNLNRNYYTIKKSNIPDCVVCSFKIITKDLTHSTESVKSLDYTINITKGWNLISPLFGSEDIETNRNILLKEGWNLFGYDSNKPFYWLDAILNNGTEEKTLDEAQSAAWLQGTIYYYNKGLGYYQFIPQDISYLETKNAYWLYAFEDLTLTLPNAGGSLIDNSYYWLNASIGNGTTTKSISEAQSSGWLQGIIYYYDLDVGYYKFIPGDGDYIYPWRGYWLYSNEDLTLGFP